MVRAGVTEAVGRTIGPVFEVLDVGERILRAERRRIAMPGGQPPSTSARDTSTAPKASACRYCSSFDSSANRPFTASCWASASASDTGGVMGGSAPNCAAKAASSRSNGFMRRLRFARGQSGAQAVVGGNLVGQVAGGQRGVGGGEDFGNQIASEAQFVVRVCIREVDGKHALRAVDHLQHVDTAAHDRTACASKQASTPKQNTSA
ncbi:hypothetical protein SNK04_013824 [Fusarium graminearum]